MKIIIIGCGRLGGGVAEELCRRGIEVTVVDRDPGAFERLTPSFTGKTVTGGGIERETLIAAGIDRADGVAAVTTSDDVNIVAARLARRMFHVPRVVARLYDPRNEEVYRRLGIQTISHITWGASRIIEILCYSKLTTIKSLGSGEVDIMETEVPQLLVGRTVNDLTLPGEIRVIAITRGGKTFLPTLGSELQQGDLVHLALLSSSLQRLNEIMGM
jgi:trk system potassium uptake protein